ncbi:hypothetical protein [Aeromicrobium fastidiosum]|uniref:Uncharacterized protein n=1 Tax=Aeromicrobium fastidiosum TaxID=52699 RepID=A0A641AP37_9ACTN|nr:hypothetical protein [Aeromicrobium fastidiosum]KAA1379705.1 hypothetical protein ESP62_000340 [Aeromicrobium fastidiosum]MBP2389189.1 uncharacterized membrane protein YoaK (UPF0700 family) [Aeromicrobium fastidiosum]
MSVRELSIEQVQRWVVSFLILAVASFPLGALTAVSRTIDREGRHSDAVLLVCVMAALGTLALAAIRLVHRRPPASPWLVLGLVPALLAALVAL